MVTMISPEIYIRCPKCGAKPPRDYATNEVLEQNRNLSTASHCEYVRCQKCGYVYDP